jgi:uncharacterized protein (UPF0297 family)
MASSAQDSGSDRGSAEPPAEDAGLTRVLRGGRGGSDGAGSGVEPLDSREVLLRVYRALQEKGYDPIGQIAHYLLSGEPTYITGHQNARSLMTRLERDEIIAELVRAYIARLTGEEPARRRA